MSTTKYLPLDVLGRIADAMPPESRGAFVLSMQTGVRVSDAICATAGDFDAHGYYHYRAHKTGKAGRARVTDDFIAQYVRGLSPGEWLFRSKVKPGAHITRQTVFNHVKHACKLLGVNPAHVAPHTARKAFAVDLFKREGLGKAMHALQHRDAATTLLYALSDDPIPEIIRRLDKLDSSVAQLAADVEALADRVFGDDIYLPVAGSESNKPDS